MKLSKLCYRNLPQSFNEISKVPGVCSAITLYNIKRVNLRKLDKDKLRFLIEKAIRKKTKKLMIFLLS